MLTKTEMTQRHESETGRLLGKIPLPGGYQLLRLQLPLLSQQVAAGQQLAIEDVLLPVMRNHAGQQWVELLSTTMPPWASSENAIHCELLGKPFQLPHTPVTALLIAEDLGLAPIVFLADTLRKQHRHSLLVLLGFSGAIPFRPAPSRIIINSLPAGVIATMPLLEDWSVACRIAHVDEPPGCFGGDVVELARHWLQQPNGAMQLFISGNKKMTETGTCLGEAFGLESQAIAVLD